MLQQLVKKGSDGRYSNVIPNSWIEVITDKSKLKNSTFSRDVSI